jgi:hypothetical protein
MGIDFSIPIFLEHTFFIPLILIIELLNILL